MFSTSEYGKPKIDVSTLTPSIQRSGTDFNTWSLRADLTSLKSLYLILTVLWHSATEHHLHPGS